MATKLSKGCFYGEVLKSRGGRGLTLTETRYLPHFKIPKHLHHHAYFGFLLQGTFSEFYDQKNIVCEPATLVFHPSEEVHSEYFHNTGGRLFNIEIDSRWLERFDGQHILPKSTIARNGGLTSFLATKLYREFGEFDEVSLLSIDGLLLELLAESYRVDKKSSDHQPSRWLRQVKELLHDKFSEPLALRDIADTVGMNPTYVAQTFRRHFRYTIGEYIRHLRIEFACCEISRSASSFSQIAVMAGFSDQAHFSRTFKKLMAMTPSQYRTLVHGS